MGEVVRSLYPSADWRYALAKGMRGTDVAALQINLGKSILADGVYGPNTKRAVERFQEAHNLTPIDGVAGPKTQTEMVLIRCRESEDKYGLPKGLLASVAVNESGLFLACYSDHPSDEGFDLGALQDSITPEQLGDQLAYKNAYNVEHMAEVTAAKIKKQFGKYYNAQYVKTPSKYGIELVPLGEVYDRETYAWQLAIFFHNWESGADNLAYRGYITSYGDDVVPENNWIYKTTKGRISTPHQWLLSYVQKSTVFINW